MDSIDSLPGPCQLCGSGTGTRIDHAWVCTVCGWRYGDVPDADLPLPRIDVVYYLRFDRRVKIGTSRRPRQRLASIRHDELLGFERGDRTVEHRRHVEFASLREGGEWFTLSSPCTSTSPPSAPRESPGISMHGGSARPCSARDDERRHDMSRAAAPEENSGPTHVITGSEAAHETA